MNNQIPFFNPYINHKDSFMDLHSIDYLEEKVGRLEKDLHLLENRIKKLENGLYSKNNNDYFNSEPTDMYMI